MSSFLAQLAEKIAVQNEIPLEQTVVVVPNKRAKRELLRELAFHFTKPVFAPHIISVSEFIESLSSLKKIENNELLIRLFEVYKKKNAKKSDDFVAFLAWAPLFLSDINEIDMHLADAIAIFSNLSEIKTLETSFGKENLTEMQRKYLEFYVQLADLYIDFTKMLRDENLGYEGMIYRDVAVSFNHEECKDTQKISLRHWEWYKKSHTNAENIRFIFAGFNAATPAELEILHFFYAQKNAEIFFDIDQFYDEKYGGFIQEIRQKLRIPEISKSNYYKDIPKQISFTGAPRRTAQVLQTIEILNSIKVKQENLNNTVLVFADESMLLPFVHAYNCENANITMGYPLSATFAAQQLQQYIDTEKQNNRLQKPIYHLKTQGFEFLKYLMSIFQKFENENIKSEENTYPLITKLLNELSEFFEKFFAPSLVLDFVVVEYFLKEKLNATTISFTGNPYEDLQVMGLLETRMLDFKNVIVLSMNEGILPKGKAAPSLLLYDMKMHFGLPTQQRKDAIFGYHFFRLLQRAENVYLIYDNESTNSLAEKSRFMEQLEFEVKKQNLQESIQIFHNQFVVPFTFPTNAGNINIKKSVFILEKLANYHYSPTALLTYIQCPLQFYWKHIEKITATKIFDESNESAIIGTVIHSILEEIFVQLQQKPAQFSGILSEFVENIDEVLFRVFKKQPELAHENIEQGKLFLAYQIVKKTVLDYIDIIRNEWKSSVYQIICTETWLNAEVNIGEKKLRIAGKADRIEMRDNKATILDYKTGKVEARNLKCKTENWEEIFTDSKYSQLFQLLCYAYLYQNDKENALLKTAEIQCGIIAFQELYKHNEQYIYYAEIDKEKILTREMLQFFEEHLKQIFSSILDETTAFTQTEKEENCQYCDYKGICNR
jgi:CRISPR/Cas system-associated exonuclease Cas4 (RecB family)